MVVKKTFSLALLFVGLLFISTNVKALDECYLTNNNDVCIGETEYTNLLNLGFDEFEIRNLTHELYDENKDLIGEVVADTTKYYIDTNYYFNGSVISNSVEVTEQEYNSLIPTQNMMGLIPGASINYYDGYTETTGKKMRTKIIEQGNYMRYKNTVDWKVMPIRRSYDIIGIGLEQTKVYPYGNKTFSQTYCTSEYACTSETTPKYLMTMESGVSATFKLPEGSYVSMSAMLYYDVDKLYNNTITCLYAYGDYAHATSNVTWSQAAYGHDISAAGITLATSISSYFDAIDEAVSNWTGNW